MKNLTPHFFSCHSWQIGITFASTFGGSKRVYSTESQWGAVSQKTDGGMNPGEFPAMWHEKGKVNGCQSKLMLIWCWYMICWFFYQRVWFENWSEKKGGRKHFLWIPLSSEAKPVFPNGCCFKYGRYAVFLMMARNYFWKADSQLQLLTS